MNFPPMIEAVRLRGTGRGHPPDERAHPWRVGQKGAVRTRILLLILVGVVTVYVGSQVVSAYVEYITLFETVQRVVSDMVIPPRQGVEEGRTRILADARELGMFLSDDEVSITVSEESVVVRVRWEKSIGLWEFTYPYPFEIEEKRPLR